MSIVLFDIGNADEILQSMEFGKLVLIKYLAIHVIGMLIDDFTATSNPFSYEPWRGTRTFEVSGDCVPLAELSYSHKLSLCLIFWNPISL